MGRDEKAIKVVTAYIKVLSHQQCERTDENHKEIQAR
jgi:hypothetical protein